MNTSKTPEQIAQSVLDSHSIKADWRRTGEQIQALIIEAIEADRAQLYQRVLTFEPDAIRDHFEGDETDPTEGLTTAQLDEIGQGCLQDDRLYRAFHEVLTDAITDYREGNWR